jgi:hypothetical protein
MTTLRGLNPGVRALLTDDFRQNGGHVDASEFVVADLGLGRQVNVEPLRAIVDEAMSRFASDPVRSDAWLGPRVHATLRLTRREAADKRVWAYLCVVEFADYIRWRWPPRDEETPVPYERFVGPESVNALGRLWWAAELVRNGSDYKPAAHALSINRFYMWQKLNFLHHKAGAVAAARFLIEFGGKGASNTEALAMGKALNLALRTLSLDAIASSPPPDGDAIRDWIAGRVDETTMMGDELPEGPDEAAVPEADLIAVRRLLDQVAARISLSNEPLPEPMRGT